MSRAETAWLALGVIAMGFFLGVCMVCLIAVGARAEELRWTLCQPDSEIMIREGPGKRYTATGAVTCGEQLTTDGKEADGWIHVVGLSSESGEGWIFGGYVTDYPAEEVGMELPIVSRGRVACRKWIGGKRRSWIRSGETVRVYWMAGEWAVTSRGFIRSEYIGEAEAEWPE